MPHTVGGGSKNSQGKVDQAKKEAEKAAEEDKDKSKAISFGSGNSKPRAPTTIKSVLRKVSRETIKTYQHELVVDVRVNVQHTRKKNKVRKKVCAVLGETLDFIRGTLLENKMDINFLGKKGRKSTKNHIRMTADFPLTALELMKALAPPTRTHSVTDTKELPRQ